MSSKTELVSVPRELLQHAVNAVGYLSLRGDDVGTSNVPVADALRALLAAPAEDVRAVVEEPVAVRDFANELISAAYEGGAFDAGDIQDLAVKHGLLSIEPRAEACGEACRCSEYGFPTECLRKTSLLKPAQ